MLLKWCFVGSSEQSPRGVEGEVGAWLVWGWGDTLGVASPQAIHSCNELGLPAVHPHPSCPDLCVLGKKVTLGWPCAHSWQLPGGHLAGATTVTGRLSAGCSGAFLTPGLVVSFCS